MQTKRCTVCGVEKPATLEFFRKNSTHKYGLYSQCKPCERPRVNIWVKSERYKEKRKKFQKLPRVKTASAYRASFAKRMRFLVRRWNKPQIPPIEQLIGYDMHLVIPRFESLFRDGMTWDNYGEIWHIDHIRPVSSFKNYPFDLEAVRECWKLENLQPLLIAENIKKGNKFPHSI